MTDAAKSLECLRDSIHKLERRPLFILVEDDEADAMLIRNEIDHFFRKCFVLTCATGEEAVILLRDIKADAVFIDLRLPGMSGIQLVDKIKAHHAVSIIVITGLPHDSDMTIEALRHGVVKVISKPVSQSDLLNVFQTL